MSRPARLIILACGLLVAGGFAVTPAAAAAARQDARPDQGGNAREALREGDYPWYDSGKDRFHRLRLPADPDVDLDVDVPGSPSFLGAMGGLGQVIVVGIFVAALVAIVVLAIRLRDGAGGLLDGPERAKSPSRAVERSGVLPAGLEVDAADPWAAAIEARRKGDLGRAIILLFAHQLMALDRQGMVRLAPGRTGRQLVRSVGEREIRARVEPTLRLFEAVYYGREAPDPSRFEHAWSEAQALESLLAGRAGR
jgi:hypothetical protein